MKAVLTGGATRLRYSWAKEYWPGGLCMWGGQEGRGKGSRSHGALGGNTVQGGQREMDM